MTFYTIYAKYLITQPVKFQIYTSKLNTTFRICEIKSYYYWTRVQAKKSALCLAAALKSVSWYCGSAKTNISAKPWWVQLNYKDSYSHTRKNYAPRTKKIKCWKRQFLIKMTNLISLNSAGGVIALEYQVFLQLWNQMAQMHPFYLFARPPKLIRQHDDVIKWKHFPRYWPFVRGIHRSPVNSPHKGQWRGALMFYLICVWINDWVNNREAGGQRRHRAHCDVIVMSAARRYCGITSNWQDTYRKTASSSCKICHPQYQRASLSGLKNITTVTS